MTRYILAHQQARDNAARAVREAPEGHVVTIKPPTKKRAQEEKYHAQIGEIAKQWRFLDQSWDEDDMKRLLIDMFAQYMRELGTPLHHDGRVVPSLDGKRVVQLGIQSRDFYVSEASAFIEFLYAFGAERGVKFSEQMEEA
jgi:hypothetical protein